MPLLPPAEAQSHRHVFCLFRPLSVPLLPPAEAQDFIAANGQPAKSSGSKRKSGDTYPPAPEQRSVHPAVQSAVHPAAQGQQLQRLSAASERPAPQASALPGPSNRLPNHHPSDPDPQHPSTLVAFCDGSAIGNGRSGCRAGWASIFPHNPEWSEAGPLAGPVQTNNRAEFSAAIAAMRQANHRDPSARRPLYIFTDSMLLIRRCIEEAPVSDFTSL